MRQRNQTLIRSKKLSVQEMEALNAYGSTLKSRLGDQLIDILLFGSKARGDAHPTSDIDILVILDRENPEAFSEARGLGFDILLAYDLFLSIRVVSQQQWQTLADSNSIFYHNVEIDGVSLLPQLTAS
jgi:predicted nucleotidyltransferase